MTILDNFSRVLFNDGEELTYGDLINQQKSGRRYQMDQLLATLTSNLGSGVAYDPEFAGQLGLQRRSPVPGPYAIALDPGGAYLRQGSANNKVQIAPGTLLQYVQGVAPLFATTLYAPGDQAASSGNLYQCTIGGTTATDTLTGTGAAIVNGTATFTYLDLQESQILSFTFDGSTAAEFTITNGNISNPRVDLLQMSLSLVDGDSTSRTFAQVGVKAYLNLAGVTAHDDTQVQAKVPGLAGDNISISLQKRLSGSGVTYSESGNAILILYEDGVSTVALIEASIITNSTLIEIKSTGTGATVLHDPADSFAYTHLASGSDEMLISQAMNKTRRVQCALSVKIGTPAVSPIYPTLDAGCVAVGAVVVGTNYVAAAGFYHDDRSGAVAVLHDQRMPLRVRTHTILARSFIYSTGSYSLDGSGTYVQKTDNSGNNIYAPLGECGYVGRLVNVASGFKDVVTLDSRLTRLNFTNSGGSVGVIDIDVAHANLNGSGSGTFKRQSGVVLAFQGTGLPMFSVGPVVQENAAGIGPPIWTNGQRAPTEAFLTGSQDFDCLALKFVGNPYGGNDSGSQYGPVSFYVAEGL